MRPIVGQPKLTLDPSIYVAQCLPLSLNIETRLTLDGSGTACTISNPI